MSNGEWLCGSSLEPDWISLMEIYSPEQDRWIERNILKASGSSINNGIIQPTVWESEPGRVHTLMRSSMCRLFRADSADYGRTWNMPYAIELPSNNSGIDLARLPGGELVLAYPDQLCVAAGRARSVQSAMPTRRPGPVTSRRALRYVQPAHSQS